MSGAQNCGVTGAILAGGAARRMQGNDKGLLPLCGEPLIKHTLTALAPQVERLMINANRNLQDYAAFGYPVTADDRQGLQGPLAGMLRCLQQAETEFVVVVPCDSPFLPDDLVERLLRQLRKRRARPQRCPQRRPDTAGVHAHVRDPGGFHAGFSRFRRTQDRSVVPAT